MQPRILFDQLLARDGSPLDNESQQLLNQFVIVLDKDEESRNKLFGKEYQDSLLARKILIEFGYRNNKLFFHHLSSLLVQTSNETQMHAVLLCQRFLEKSTGLFSLSGQDQLLLRLVDLAHFSIDDSLIAAALYAILMLIPFSVKSLLTSHLLPKLFELFVSELMKADSAVIEQSDYVTNSPVLCLFHYFYALFPLYFVKTLKLEMKKNEKFREKVLPLFASVAFNVESLLLSEEEELLPVTWELKRDVKDPAASLRSTKLLTEYFSAQHFLDSKRSFPLKIPESELFAALKTIHRSPQSSPVKRFDELPSESEIPSELIEPLPIANNANENLSALIGAEKPERRLSAKDSAGADGGKGDVDELGNEKAKSAIAWDPIEPLQTPRSLIDSDDNFGYLDFARNFRRRSGTESQFSPSNNNNSLPAFAKYFQRMLLQSMYRLKFENSQLLRRPSCEEYKLLLDDLSTTNRSLMAQIATQQKMCYNYKQRVHQLNSHLLMVKSNYFDKETQVISSNKNMQSTIEEQQAEIKNLEMKVAALENKIYMSNLKLKSHHKYKTLCVQLKEQQKRMDEFLLLSQEQQQSSAALFNAKLAEELKKRAAEQDEYLYHPSSQSALKNSDDEPNDSAKTSVAYNLQILELENEELERKVASLQGMLEKQKHVNVAKVEAVNGKYQQIKIINELLQRELMSLKAAK